RTRHDREAVFPRTGERRPPARASHRDRSRRPPGAPRGARHRLPGAEARGDAVPARAHRGEARAPLSPLPARRAPRRTPRPRPAAPRLPDVSPPATREARGPRLASHPRKDVPRLPADSRRRDPPIARFRDDRDARALRRETESAETRARGDELREQYDALAA